MNKKLKDFEFQPPEKIGNTKVSYAESTIAEFRGDYWITLIERSLPSDTIEDKIWEFNLNTGKLLRTQ